MAKFLKELAAEGLSGAGEASVARGFSRTSGVERSKQEGQHLGAGFSMTSSYKRTWAFVVLNLGEHNPSSSGRSQLKVWFFKTQGPSNVAKTT